MQGTGTLCYQQGFSQQLPVLSIRKVPADRDEEGRYAPLLGKVLVCSVVGQGAGLLNDCDILRRYSGF